MANTDSDSDISEYDSAMSSSVHAAAKFPIIDQSITKGSDRLYSISTTHRDLGPDSEHSPLLTHRDGSRGYISPQRLDSFDQFDSSGSSPRPLGILTRKISRVFQSKAYDYDSNKQSLAAVGSGERVWYLLFTPH